MYNDITIGHFPLKLFIIIDRLLSYRRNMESRMGRIEKGNEHFPRDDFIALQQFRAESII